MLAEHGLLERSYDVVLCDLSGDVAEMLTSESLGALKRRCAAGPA